MQCQWQYTVFKQLQNKQFIFSTTQYVIWNLTYMCTHYGYLAVEIFISRIPTTDS